MIKSVIFFGILTYALSSMNVILMVQSGINAGSALAAAIGYVVGTYLFYYGIFVKEEPSLKERMKEEQTRKRGKI